MNDPNFEKPCEFDASGNCIHHNSPRRVSAKDDLEAAGAVVDLLKNIGRPIAQAGMILSLPMVMGSPLAVTLEGILRPVAEAILRGLDTAEALQRDLAAKAPQPESTADTTLLS